MKIEIPSFLSHLKISERGYPIPWFVPINKGVPEFSYQDGKKLDISIDGHLCHICGKKLPKDYIYFISGPEGLKNQFSTDMGMHRDCAEYSLQVCPYMLFNKVDRKTEDPKDGIHAQEKPPIMFLIKAHANFNAKFVKEMGYRGIFYKAVSSEKYGYVDNKLTKIAPDKNMTFQDALKKLDIEDYGEQIFNSNSHGELFHLGQYIRIAEQIKNEDGWFREWFIAIVELAKSRPDSKAVFQHIEKMLVEWFEHIEKHE